jgi:hypothetical protein
MRRGPMLSTNDVTASQLVISADEIG